MTSMPPIYSTMAEFIFWVALTDRTLMLSTVVFYRAHQEYHPDGNKGQGQKRRHAMVENKQEKFGCL